MSLYLLVFYQSIYFPLTVLQAPLNLSSTDFTFVIPSYAMNPNKKVTVTQVRIENWYSSQLFF